MEVKNALFRDRLDAGDKLATRLEKSQYVDPIILAIPRGGVPIGRVIADRLSSPLSVFVSRKIRAPSMPEFGVGAITEEGTYLLDYTSIELVGAEMASIEAIIERESKRCRQYVSLYRHGDPLPDLSERTVILTDDGLATGITMLAAVEAVRLRRPQMVIVAVPVASAQAVKALTDRGVQVYVIAEPVDFRAVGQFYVHFDQLTDQQVLDCL